MMVRLGVAILLLSCRCFAGLPPVEGEAGPTPPPEPTPSDAEKRRLQSIARDANSDEHGYDWEYKFKVASDKRLGSVSDATTIKALVPENVPPTLRWVSRTVVVVVSACRFDASSTEPQRCLYVFENTVGNGS